MFCIRLRGPRGEAEVVRIDADVVHVGRGNENEIVLETPLASRLQCRIFRAAGRTMIEDLRSRNGTYVDEERVLGSRELPLATTVHVPGYTLVLERDDVVDTTSHSSAEQGHPTTLEVKSDFDTAAAAAATLAGEEAQVVDEANEGKPKDATRRGFSPLVSYGGYEAGRELGREASQAFAHQETLTVVGVVEQTSHASDAPTGDDPTGEDSAGFGEDGPRTDPSVAPIRNHAGAITSSSSQAGVPIEARELRASLFQLFHRAVKRSPPAPGRNGRAALRKKIAESIPHDDDRLSYLATQSWPAEIVEELLGYGPLTPLLANPNVTSVVVEGVSAIRVQRGGAFVPVGSAFTSQEALTTVSQRLMEEASGEIVPSDHTQTYRLPSGLEVIVHRRSEGSAPFTVVKPVGVAAHDIEQRLHRRAQEVAEASDRRDT